MKNVTKLLTLVLFFSISANSYTQSIGLKVGANIASWAGDDIFDEDVYSSVTGLQLGLVAEIPFSDKFAVQPELLYLQKGSAAEFEFLGDKITTTTKFNYLEIPILAKFALTDGPAQVFLNAGPSIGFGLNGTLTTEAGGAEEESDLDFDEEGIVRMDLGLALGAGVQFNTGPGKLFVDVRYLMGLTSLDDSEPEEEQIDIFNRGISASVGFTFPIGN